MKILISSLLFLSLIIPARGEDLPDAAKSADTPAAKTSPNTMASPSPSSTVLFPKKVFWPLVAACGAAASFDAQMSRAYLVSHPNSKEGQSWLLGDRPSLGRYYATFAVMDGGVAAISYKLVHSRRKPVRVIGWGILTYLTGLHTYDDIVLAAR